MEEDGDGAEQLPENGNDEYSNFANNVNCDNSVPAEVEVSFSHENDIFTPMIAIMRCHPLPLMLRVTMTRRN